MKLTNQNKKKMKNQKFFSEVLIFALLFAFLIFLLSI